jgi:hypothetical protein
MEYVKIKNMTESVIVINSCNITLKPKSEPGSEVIVNGDHVNDRDVVGLVNAGLAIIESVEPIPILSPSSNDKSRSVVKTTTAPKTKKKSSDRQTGRSVKKATKKNKKKATARTREKMSEVTYIDRGKIKKGKMSKRPNSMINLPMNQDDDDSEDLSPAFVQ